MFDVVGRLTIGAPVEQLDKAVSAALKRGEKFIVLNLAQAPYADSCGIGQLLNCLKTVSASGGKLKLTNVSSRVDGVMRLTRSFMLFEFYESETAAVRSFV